jgi:leucyl-tRNA synthetase
VVVPVDISDEDAKELALGSEAVGKYLQGKPPRKVILVPGKLVNIVV